MKHLWEEMDAKKKAGVVITLAGVVVVSAVALTSPDDSGGSKKNNRQETIKHVLTDQNTRDIGIDSLSADLKIVSQENKELKKSIQKLEQLLEGKKLHVQQSDEVNKQLSQLQREITELKKDNQDLSESLEEQGSVPEVSGDAVVFGSNLQSANYNDPNSFFQNAPIPQAAGGEGNSANGVAAEGISIMSYAQEQPETEAKEGVSDAKDDAIYIPTGSILTGVMINGMDALTSNGARKNPFPSTVRISKEAILPNRYRADIRECFLSISGYGDLSSERAYLRSELLSCVTDDGGVIEAQIHAYAVGEDGKAGIRGRLVSKQGQMIAKSMMAGFMSGVSKAFDVNPVPVVNTSPGDTTQYQSVFSTDLIQGAAVKGASDALDRVAQFYVEMAENLFPVIEIDAGREVDVILTSGASLKIKSKKKV